MLYKLLGQLFNSNFILPLYILFKWYVRFTDNVLPALGSTIKISVETNFEISSDWGVKFAFVHGHLHLKIEVTRCENFLKSIQIIRQRLKHVTVLSFFTFKTDLGGILGGSLRTRLVLDPRLQLTSSTNINSLSLNW